MAHNGSLDISRYLSIKTRLRGWHPVGELAALHAGGWDLQVRFGWSLIKKRGQAYGKYSGVVDVTAISAGNCRHFASMCCRLHT
jgi:hypothetical protein